MLKEEAIKKLSENTGDLDNPIKTAVAPAKRTRGPNKPKIAAPVKGRRRSTNQARIALALVDSYMAGVEAQLGNLKAALRELKTHLG